MNVSSTRKVSSSSSPIKRTERHYAPGAEGHPFVEVVDTTNNVLVRDESDASNRRLNGKTTRKNKAAFPRERLMFLQAP